MQRVGLPPKPVNADDSRHSVLSKARPLSQTALSAFLAQEGRRAQALLPPSEFGTYEVREIDAKQALTKCAMPSEPWALNPYMGCSHDCAYCYVPDVAHVERPRWASYVIVKRNLPTLLSHEVHRREPREVFLSSATDPYQPVEGTHQITRRCLEVLARADWPIHVLTRNPLVRRDATLLKRFSSCSVGMSVPTLDDEMRRLVEPSAPSIDARLRTLRELADEGLDTFANIAPAYPLSGGVTPRDIASAFRDAGVRVVHVTPWRYLASVLPVLEQRLPADAYETFARAVADKKYYQRLFLQLRAAFRGTGVVCSTMEPEPSMGPNRLDWSQREP
ncbi:MAG TPA: radical SAM protein [Candidatus Thermoplasmatota archaeon]|nr:radical SAM protein [Candidatus Thermoplasmatota archaeon]